MKKMLLKLTVLAAALALVVLGCDNPAGSDVEGGGGGSADKSALEAAIGLAQNAKSGVKSSTDGSDVPIGTKWVSINTMAALNNVILSAETIRGNASADQAVVDAAVNALTSQTEVFIGEKQYGAKNSGLTQEDLVVLIDAAVTAAESGVVSAEDADNVPPDTRWVPAALIEALTDKIEEAETIRDNGGNIDSAGNDLFSALTAFEDAIEYGTPLNKTALIGAITDAETAKDEVAVAASKDEAPYGSEWATAVQWAPFNAALDAAIAARDEAAVQAAVNSAKDALESATTTFAAAVSGNGLGEKPQTLTITGLPSSFYTGADIIAALFDAESITTYEDLDDILAAGTGSVSSGSVEVSLLESQFDGSEPWGGSGNYWVVFTWNTDSSFLDIYCSRAKVTVSGDTTLAYTTGSFKQVPYGGEFELPYGTLEMTLDALLVEAEELSGYNEFKAVYKSYVDAMAYEEYGITISTDYTLYKNPELTSPFTGTDTVTEGMPFYTKFSMNLEGDDDDDHPERGEQTGTISGTVSLTNAGSNIEKIEIFAYQGMAETRSWGSYSGDVKQTGSFTIPLYENDADANPGFNPANPVYFILKVDYTDDSEYYGYINEGKTGIAHDNDNNVGTIGPADMTHLVVSGTITITVPAGTIRYRHVLATLSGVPSQLYQTDVQSSGAWVLRLPPSAAEKTLSFYVEAGTEEDHYYRDLSRNETVNSGGNTGINLGTVNLTVTDKQ